MAPKATQEPLLPPTDPAPSTIDIEELDEANNVISHHVITPQSKGDKPKFQTSSVRRVDDKTARTNRIQSYSKILIDAFLPVGFPDSVTEDYLEYQIYDSLQAFSSSIAGMLSSRAVLEGIGVGSTHTTPTAALLLSILQSSLGRMATILFASHLSSSLEPECKAYRFLADIFNDMSIILDCISPVLDTYGRVSVLCGASVLRALCGVAAGSAKASLSMHFAKRGNVGELSAKDSSQETVISLMGMLAGSVIVPYITSTFATWFSLLLLLSIHLYTNYRAVRAVCLPTLNCQRACIVFSDFLALRNASRYIMLDEKNTGKPRILTPREVFRKEKIFASPSLLRDGEVLLGRCRVGVSMTELMSLCTMDSFTFQMRLCDELPYIPVCDLETGIVLISLKEHSQRVYLQAWLHAMMLVTVWDQTRETSDASGGKNMLLSQAALRVGEMWDDVEKGLVEVGWNIEDVAILTVGRSTIRMGGNGGRENKKEL